MYSRVGNKYLSESFVEKFKFSFVIVVHGVFEFIVELQLFFFGEFGCKVITFECKVIRYLYWYMFRCISVHV